jgi:hypothetical protein
VILAAFFSFVSGYGMLGAGTAVVIVFFGSIFIKMGKVVARPKAVMKSRRFMPRPRIRQGHYASKVAPKEGPMIHSLRLLRVSAGPKPRAAEINLAWLAVRPREQRQVDGPVISSGAQIIRDRLEHLMPHTGKVGERSRLAGAPVVLRSVYNFQMAIVQGHAACDLPKIAVGKLLVGDAADVAFL